MKTVELENMTITVEGHGGAIESRLVRETCPFCETPNCFYDCDGSQGAFSQPELQEENEVLSRHRYNFALDAIESYTLALVIALNEKTGLTAIGTLQSAINEAISTTLDTIGQNCED